MWKIVVIDTMFIRKEGLIKKIKTCLKSTIEKIQNNIFEVISSVNLTTNLEETADLVTEEILDGKLHYMFSVMIFGRGVFV